MRVVAVEEHMATEAFLRVAHGLDVAPSDQAEMNGMRTMESDPAFRARLTDLASRLREMDALGQDMAVLSLNPRSDFVSCCLRVPVPVGLASPSAWAGGRFVVVALFLVIELLGDGIDGLAGRRFGEVPIDVGCGGDRGVAQGLRHDGQLDAVGECQCCGEVAQVVDAGAGNACLAGEVVEVVEDVLRVQRAPVFAMEDESTAWACARTADRAVLGFAACEDSVDAG
jgi:hypothetical protein